MTAKDYLSEIHRLQVIIGQKGEERSYLKAVNKSLFPKEEGKLQKLLLEIDGEIAGNLQKMQERIGQIYSMPDIKSIRILYMRYVEFKTYEAIAEELSYSESYVAELHKKALKAFERIFLTSVY